MKDAKVAVVKVENVKLEAPKISKISRYLSIKFNDDHTALSRIHHLHDEHDDR